MEPQELWPHLPSEKLRWGHPLPIKPLLPALAPPLGMLAGVGSSGAGSAQRGPHCLWRVLPLRRKLRLRVPAWGQEGHAGPQVPHLGSVLLARFPDWLSGKTPGVLLCLPLRCWVYSCVPRCLAKWVLGIPTQALVLAQISPVPIYLPLFIK